MRAPWVFLGLGDRRRLALQLEDRLVQRRRTDVVLATDEEKQGWPRRVVEVDRRRRVRAQCRERVLEEGAIRARDVLLPVDGVGLLPTERVREPPLELLLRQ